MEERKSEQRSTSRGQTSSHLSVGAKDIVPTHGHTRTHTKSHKGLPRILEIYGPFCKVICQKKGRNSINRIHVCINKNTQTKIILVFLDGPFQAQHQSLGTNMQPFKQTPQINMCFPLPCFTCSSMHCSACTGAFTVPAIRNKSAENKNNPPAGVKPLLAGWPVPPSWPSDRFMHS